MAFSFINLFEYFKVNSITFIGHIMWLLWVTKWLNSYGNKNDDFRKILEYKLFIHY